MLGLMLAALGLLSLTLLLDDDGTTYVTNPEEDDTPEDDGEEDDGEIDITDPLAPEVQGTDTANPIVALLGQGDDTIGTINNDVLGVEYGNGNPDTIEAGAGDDTLYVTGGTASGGPGDDTINMLYSVAPDVFGADAVPVALGGSGNDLIDTTGADEGIVDAGSGDDTVSVDNQFGNDFDVTLGEGSDVVELTHTEAPRDVFLTLQDFDPSEDSIEIIRPEGAESADGYDVSITPDPDGGPSLIEITMQLTDPDADAETYQILAEGVDPSHIGALDISLSDAPEDPEDTRTEIVPERIGNDLIYTITTDDVRLDMQNLADENGNPYADIDRIVLNISEDVESQYFVQEYEQFIGGSNGAVGTLSTIVAIVKGPASLEGGPMISYSIQGDDTNYLSAEVVPDLRVGLNDPMILSPYELVGSIGLGAVSYDVHDPAVDGQSTVNDVVVVINIVPASTPAT